MKRKLESSPDFLPDLGARIKGQRQYMKLSLDDLAEATDMSKTGLWEIEKGRNEPRAATLVRLSVALKVSVDYLLGL